MVNTKLTPVKPHETLELVMLLKKRQSINFELLEVFFVQMVRSIVIGEQFFISQYQGEILKNFMLFVIKL